MLEGYDKQKLGGCMAFGCMLVVVLFALGGIGAYFGVKTAIKSAAFKYTEPMPRQMPKVTMSIEDSDKLMKDVGGFTSALTKGEEAEDLELSADQVNYLIQNSNDDLFGGLRGRVHVEAFDDGKIKSEISVPLNRLGVKDLRGRYLNGEAELSLQVENGEFEFDIRAMNANGFNVPDSVFRTLKNRGDFIDRITSHPKFTKYSRYLEDIKVVGDKIRIRMKKGESFKDLQRELAGENIPL